MPHQIFHPKTATREDKRQAFEAVGRSFCKAITEPVTNSDSSAKRKLDILAASGLVDLMMASTEGDEIDTATLKQALVGRYPERSITIEVSTARSNGRRAGEIAFVDQAQGMSSDTLHDALSEIGGNKLHLSAGKIGRNLFGRGLSDVMRAHRDPVVETFDGRQLSFAKGFWDNKKGWTIDLGYIDAPTTSDFETTHLSRDSAGTAVTFLISDEARQKGCRIPEQSHIVWRLANFYMLRLISSDPNVRLVLKQNRSQKVVEERIKYDFPVGEVLKAGAEIFDPKKYGVDATALRVDFLVVRSAGKRPLASGFPDRDSRERGMLIVDDLDAVYDLTFAIQDYEKAEFLDQLWGIIRVNGLRSVLEAYLDAENPTSPLRPDRDGFNRDHEFSTALLEFIGESLRPLYEKEKHRIEERDREKLSSQTKRRVDDALKQLNRYFQRITNLEGEGIGPGTASISEPITPILFYPEKIRLIAGRPKQVLLLVRDDVVDHDTEIVASASEGFAVQPESEKISFRDSSRWSPHKRFFAVPFSVSCSELGKEGHVTSMLETKDGEIVETSLEIEAVIAEPIVQVPETMEFRPQTVNGRPERRNHIVLHVNPTCIPLGSTINFKIIKSVGGIQLIDSANTSQTDINISINGVDHKPTGQNIFRVVVAWNGTAWNQFARVRATTEVTGEEFAAEATIWLDEPDEGGFFKEIKYDEIDSRAPSQFAAGIITVNINDPLNRSIFGETKDEFDKRLNLNVEAQHRLASLLLEEASFRALQQRYDDNKIHFPERREIAEVHENIDGYKYDSAIDVYKALSR